MAKLNVSATLVSQALFRGCDKQPVICGASWDADWECVVLDIAGDGVPDVDRVVAIFHKRAPITVEFKPDNTN